MENLNNTNRFKINTNSVSHTVYFELLEKYILSEKTSELDKKHKEWSKSLSN